VHEAVKAEFTEALAAHARGLAVGDGLTAGTQLGPLANPRRLDAMLRLTADATAQGARVLAGGERIGERGSFFAPTVLADVPLSAAVFNEEPFGPLASVRGFTSLDEAIAEANRLPYGLAAYAYTRSIGALHQLSNRLEVGMVWVNQPALPWPELPFGGVKDSGHGSEGGPEALEAYLVSKTVAVYCG
jgi:succinate-semialdehyde dehydrogenase/glutarate-semialdehyde dehydrogenase